MARLARVEVFAADEIAIVHVMNRTAINVPPTPKLCRAIDLIDTCGIRRPIVCHFTGCQPMQRKIQNHHSLAA